MHIGTSKVRVATAALILSSFISIATASAVSGQSGAGERFAGETLRLEGGLVTSADSPAAPGVARVDARDIPGLRAISPPRRREGLTIELTGTGQLETYPEAKRAFLEAAAAWESLVTTPVTVSILVDFGPTRFGEPFLPGVLGASGWGLDDVPYTEVRERLVAAATTDEERALAARLPDTRVPTSLGRARLVVATPASLRALGIDVDSEPYDGHVGFNSDFAFDFDSTDGIAAGQLDFYAVALHEIGHVLGFYSEVGIRELYPRSNGEPALLDLFRFRPAVTLERFAKARRVLESGGSQVLFDGAERYDLSTGRPDFTGGDRSDPSHWKDDRLTNSYVGIMDPTLRDGQRGFVSRADLVALDLIGYDTLAGDPGALTILDGVYVRGSLYALARGLSGEIAVEVNGRVVAPPGMATIDAKNGLLGLERTVEELGFVDGPNVVRLVDAAGRRSNGFVVRVNLRMPAG